MEPVIHDGLSWSNADRDSVEVLDYDPLWPRQFRAEAARIRAALSGIPDITLEHFGSTAVPGLAAKPIIDIMVIAPDQKYWNRMVQQIQGLGYVFWTDNPRKDRMFFVRGMPPYGEARTHHIHVRIPSDAEPALRFRDYLRLHPADRDRYASLKRQLAARHTRDRDAYTNGKALFVDEILGKAPTPSPA